MKPSHAMLSGALTGLLFSVSICLIQNIPVAESLFRILILTAAGAWMGLLLAWLNQLLPGQSGHDKGRLDSNS